MVDISLLSWCFVRVYLARLFRIYARSAKSCLINLLEVGVIISPSTTVRTCLASTYDGEHVYSIYGWSCCLAICFSTSKCKLRFIVTTKKSIKFWSQSINSPSYMGPFKTGGILIDTVQSDAYFTYLKVSSRFPTDPYLIWSYSPLNMWNPVPRRILSIPRFRFG